MNVKLVCEACKKGLKIPDTVLGKKIKCPSCGAVFVAHLPPSPPPPPEPPTLLPDLSLDDEEPAQSFPEPVEEVAPVLSAADEDEEAAPPPKKKAVVVEDDEDEPKPRKKAIVVEDDDEEEPKPKKKAAVVAEEDEEESKPKKKAAVVAEDDDDDEPKPKKKAAAVVDDDEDEPARPTKKKKAAVVEEENDGDEDKPKKKAKVKAPWYLFLVSMLPLILVVAMPFGMPLFEVLSSDFMTDLYVGIALGTGTMLLCLIFTVLPLRIWLRVLFVFFFLLAGFGGAAGWIMYQRMEHGINVPERRAEKPPTMEEIALPGGLRYVDEKYGSGPEVRAGDTIEVTYSTSLKGGKIVDSQKKFRLMMNGTLMEGWNRGVPGMNVGGKRKLIIPAALAYGKKGLPPDIPADADLTSEIELLQVLNR
jgi:FKBP-type peptidyl-prolyl cis-trans isomerase